MKLRLFILPGGDVTGVHDDRMLSIFDDASPSVRRVSNVEWNNEVGVWEVRTLSGKLVMWDNLREVCLREERKLVEALIATHHKCHRQGALFCPGCDSLLGTAIIKNCAACGFAFPYHLVSDELLLWRDFNLEHLK